MKHSGDFSVLKEEDVSKRGHILFLTEVLMKGGLSHQLISLFMPTETACFKF